MRLALVLAVGLVAALDTATMMLLPLRGEGELNPAVLTLGPLAIIAKLALAAGIIMAVRRRLPYFPLVGAVAAGWWGFGAYVNTL